MDLKELYRTCFEDGAAFTEHFFYERGGFPVTVEENGEPVSMAFVCPRLLRAPEFHNELFDALPPRQNSDPLVRAAMIGGVCTHPDFRGRGYMTRVMQKTISVCRELGFEALFLSPVEPELYRRFGFVDIEWAESVRIRRSQYDEYAAYRYRDPESEQRLNALGLDSVAYHIMTAIESFNADRIGLAFGCGDFTRLAAEAETCDGLYLIADGRRALGAVMKDGNELPYVWMRNPRAPYILAKTTFGGGHPFGGCVMRRIASAPDGLSAPRVYMQALIFDRPRFEERITGFRGFYDPEIYRFLLFERY